MAAKRVSFASMAGAPVEKRPGVGAAVQPRAVPLHQVAHNPANPRESIGDVSELADSLRSRGQLQPVSVMTRVAFCAANPVMVERVDPRALYVVIEGNRRLAAAVEAGLTELKVDVNDAAGGTPEEILETALIANVHRKDLAPMEEARAIQQLLAHYGPRSQAKVARQLNKSEGWVSQRLVLLGLGPELQERVDAKELPLEQARKIGKLPAQEQAVRAEQVMRESAEAKARPRTRTAAPEGPASGRNLHAVKVEESSPAADPVPVQRDAAPVTTVLESVREVVLRLQPDGEPEATAKALMGALPPRHLVKAIEVMLDQLRVE